MNCENETRNLTFQVDSMQSTHSTWSCFLLSKKLQWSAAEIAFKTKVGIQLQIKPFMSTFNHAKDINRKHWPIH